MMRGENPVGQEPLWRRAFHVLSAIELGREAEWAGPEDLGALRTRVETLAVLFDAVPRSQVAQLPAILERWLPGVPAGAATRESFQKVARSVLQDDSRDRRSERERHRLKARTVMGLPPVGDPPLAGEPMSGERAGADAQTQGLEGLLTWFDQVEHAPHWKFLSTGVAGDAPVPIDQIYVELLAVADDDVTITGAEVYGGPARASRRVLASRYAAVGVAALLTRTLERCIVVGEPGSGKSTLVHWLTRAVNRDQHPDFDLALMVRLSAFARTLAQRPETSLLEFFFETVEAVQRREFGTVDAPPSDWRPAAAWLRHGGDSGRRLLLLDGWDEVPPQHRDVVRQAIRREEPFFVALITSRPSGLPRQFCENARVGFYHMAGLSPPAAEQLVIKVLAGMGREDLLPQIMAEVTGTADLREMSANPFLLSLLVRVLVRALGAGARSHAVVEVYRQVTDWIREYHDENHEHRLQFRPGHFDCLRRLSFFLLFEASPPRYLFGRQELLERLADLGVEPITQSRFANRADMAVDEYAFLHATFQEYFAAEHVAGLDDSELDTRIDETFFSASRLRVLELLSGLDGRARQHCVQRCEARLREPDRFGQVLVRVAQLATAGRWASVDRAAGVLRQVKSELWAFIVECDDVRLVAPAVEALAQLDPHELVRRTLERRVSETRLRMISNSVPERLLRTSGLLDLIPGEWGEYERSRRRGADNPPASGQHRVSLSDRSQTAEARRTAILRAAASGAPVVPALVAIAVDEGDDNSVREAAIDGLGMIRTSEALDALLGWVIGDRPLARDLTRAAAVSISMSDGDRLSIAPSVRDRLLSRIAALPPEAPQLMPMLSALEGNPVRDGAGVVAEIASGPAADPMTRSSAIEVLSAASDRSVVQRVVAGVVGESVRVVAEALVELAIVRRVPVPRDYLEAQIRTARNPVMLNRCLRAYLLTLEQVPPAEYRPAARFLSELAAHVLKEGNERAVQVAEALTAALIGGGRPDTPLFPDSVWAMATGVLAAFAVSPADVPVNLVELSAALVAQFRRPGAGGDLRGALDAALTALETVTDPDQNDRLRRMIEALGQRLAEVAPGDLLDYPPDCQPVRSVLQSLVSGRGWWIESRRIRDAEGDIIAPTGAVEPAPGYAGSEDLQELIMRLSDKNRRVLVSYCLLVGGDGPCAPGDTLKSIHAALVERLSGVISDNCTESLRQLFPGKSPSRASWFKALDRIQDAFVDQESAVSLLREIGLYRRRNRPRS